ncbi:MAG: hypothetical protein IKU07_05175 [Oscillospiraceae bacterium]|nr:hypothetical protein [Oscillospiraceae bacterium]
MLKKWVALLCTLALFVGLLTILPMVPEAEAAEAVSNYQVGYARVDINPYVEDGNLASGIMALPLYGSGDVWNRLSTAGLVDDNGDGKVNEEDGLKATCIAVTDHKGNTVLLITVDLIGALQSTRVRNGIMERVNAAIASGEIKNCIMDISRIYYTGTHTHNAPQADAYSSAGRTDFNNDGVDLNVVNTNLGIWIDRTVEDIADAAILALKDRSEATVTKDYIDASTCTDSAVKGKVMNSVRHYVAEDKGCIAGDNFNDRGSNPKQVTQVNDVMHLLQFSFADKTKLPIVIANWTGHPSLNNSTGTYNHSSRNCISSDYINAFRWTLERKLMVSSASKLTTNTNTLYYRVAFFQGAGGNVNPRGYEVTNGSSAYAWIDNNAKTQNTSRGVAYGRVLSSMAKSGITSSANRSTVAPGEIRNLRYYRGNVRNATGVSALAYEAAKYYQENVGSGTYKYTSPYSGGIYVIGSKYHASSLISKWNVSLQTPVDTTYFMEINTITIGKDLAFVTGSGELFDYYYKENGVYTEENNAWRDLINTETYGTPFVLELCNAMNGYVPNYHAYDYNEGSEKWARGSYEAHTTSYSQGSGEDMIKIMKSMLDTLAVSADGAKENYCQHCGITTKWLPFDGKTLMSSGHYYLPFDNHVAQMHVKGGITLCFDLNGHSVYGDTRAFYTASGDSSVLNIMDNSSHQTGVVYGCGSSTGAGVGFGGGTLIVDKGNTVNLYSGTLANYERGINTVSSGAVVYVSSGGTMNMYGGTIRGGTANSFEGSYINGGVKTASRTAQGGTMYLVGTLNMYGGSIESGTLKLVAGYITQDRYGNNLYNYTVTDKETGAACIYSAKGKVNVAGNAKIADVTFSAAPSSYFAVNAENGDFTGNVNISYASEISSGKVGKITEGATLLPGTVTYTFGDVETVIEDNYLVFKAMAVTKGVESGFRYYTTLVDALEDYKDSSATYIRLQGDVGENVSVPRTTNLDLNGYYIDGNVTVANGATLYCMDSKTDDYSVSDDRYGRLTGALHGNVEAVQPMTVGAVKSGNRAGYLKVSEGDGVSFHRVELNISKMNLRPDCAGVYYQSPFKGDQVVARHVKSFGISLSVESADGTKTMLPGTYTVNTGFAAGSKGNLKGSTLVTGILKQENSTARNLLNAKTNIYACAYLQTDDGFVFGAPVGRSLQQQLTDIDGIWDNLTETQQTAVNKLYETYKEVMSLLGLAQLGGNKVA